MLRDSESPSFAARLRRHRLAAGLTQEALAERAGMSARGIQNLEGGVTRPARDSARRLAAALGLTSEEGASFLAAAQPAPRRAAGAKAGADRRREARSGRLSQSGAFSEGPKALLLT
jgi:transcriptional regulator with XRE-family HTH domain